MATAVEAPASAEGLVQYTRFAFHPAIKHATFPRVGIDGASGSGRTLTGLRLARGLGSRIAVIDTHGGAASRYAAEAPFEILEMTRFDPDDLVTALAAAATSGHDVVVVDDFSAFWSGPGGLLEKVDQAAQAKGGTTSAAWSAQRPSERRMLGAIKAYPGPVVLLMNSKVDTVLEPDGEGGHVVRRIALRPEQREGLDYDLTFLGSMRDAGAYLDITKSPLLADTGPCLASPGEELGRELLAWARDGEPTGLGLPLLQQARDADLTLTGLADLWAAAAAARALDMAVLDMAGVTALTLLELLVQRTYEHLGADDLTVEGLRALWHEVAEAQALDTPLSHQGRPTTIRAVLEARGRALSEQARRAQVAAQREAEQARTRAEAAAAEQDRLAEGRTAQVGLPDPPVDWSTALPATVPWPSEPLAEEERGPVEEDPGAEPTAGEGYGTEDDDDLARLLALVTQDWKDLDAMRRHRATAQEQGLLHFLVPVDSGGEHKVMDLLDTQIADLEQAAAQLAADVQAPRSAPRADDWVEPEAPPFTYVSSILDSSLAEPPAAKDQIERLARFAARRWDKLHMVEAVQEKAQEQGLLDERVHDAQMREHTLGALLAARTAHLRQEMAGAYAGSVPQ